MGRCRSLLAAGLVGVASASGGCSNGTSVSASASACATGGKTAASCPVRPATTCVDGVCGLASLPTGLACASSAPCGMNVDPCPDWQKYAGAERVDGYGCACVDGRWSCALCWPGAGLCAELPDGAPALRFPDASTED